MTKHLAFAALLGLFGTQAFAQEGEHRGPPQEALAACTGLSEGAACAFTHDTHNISGTCRTGPNGGAVACAPAGGPGGMGHRGPPPEALAACSGKAESDACSVTLRGQAMTGTCRKGPGGEAVACMPAGMGPPPRQ